MIGAGATSAYGLQVSGVGKPETARRAPQPPWPCVGLGGYERAAPPNSRAASSSASHWRARWCSSPRCCCSTSRCPTWTRGLRRCHARRNPGAAAAPATDRGLRHPRPERGPGRPSDQIIVMNAGADCPGRQPTRPYEQPCKLSLWPASWARPVLLAGQCLRKTARCRWARLTLSACPSHAGTQARSRRRSAPKPGPVQSPRTRREPAAGTDRPGRAELLAGSYQELTGRAPNSGPVFIVAVRIWRTHGQRGSPSDAVTLGVAQSGVSCGVVAA